MMDSGTNFKILFGLLFAVCAFGGLISKATPACATASSALANKSKNVSVRLRNIDVHWDKLALEATLPKPFQHVKVITTQTESDGVTQITNMTIIVNGHSIEVPSRLLKNLVMADYPELSYPNIGSEAASLPYFSVLFKYGFPVKGGDPPYCIPFSCTAYRVAIFNVDSTYQVTREKDEMLWKGSLSGTSMNEGRPRTEPNE
jgi:hypothetical protein